MSAALNQKSILRLAFDAALTAGHPGRITRAAMQKLRLQPTAIIAIGKAAASMAQAARDAGLTAPGIMVTNDESFAPVAGMDCFTSAHPVPDQRGVDAANAIGALVDRLGGDDHLLLLISGGGSALVPALPEGISLADKQQLNEALLGSGLDIHEMNIVRRLFSALKGGRLARRAYPAGVTSFLLSDVPGDRLESIASGPAVADPTDFDAACALIRQHKLDELSFVPPYLAALEVDPTRRPVAIGDPVMDTVTSEILASNQLCQDAANDYMTASGEFANGQWRFDLPPLVGDVRDCALALADAVCAASPAGYGVTGGETTVQLGDGGVGLGGRSQELALIFAAIMHGRGDAPAGWTILAGGTDGRDGPTDAAGAIIGGSDDWDGRAAMAALDGHDVYPLLARQNQLLEVEPTGTNLADIVIISVN